MATMVGTLTDLTAGTSILASTLNANNAAIETKFDAIMDADTGKIVDDLVVNDSITDATIGIEKIQTADIVTATTAISSPGSDEKIPTEKAVVAHVTTAIAEKGYYTSGATDSKFDGSASATVGTSNLFEDVDISAIVGARSALVYIRVKATATTYAAFKPKGAPGTGAEHGSDSGATHDGCSHLNAIANDYEHVIVATNSSGVFQFAANGTAAKWTFVYVGYVI